MSTQNMRQVLATLEILDRASASAHHRGDGREKDRIADIRDQLLKRAVEVIADELVQPDEALEA